MTVDYFTYIHYDFKRFDEHRERVNILRLQSKKNAIFFADNFLDNFNIWEF